MSRKILLWSLVLTGTLLCFELMADEGTIKLDVKGLGCPFCAYGIDKRIKKIEGVQSVKVDLKMGRVTVMLKPGMSVSEDALKDAIREGGFTAVDAVGE